MATYWLAVAGLDLDGWVWREVWDDHVVENLGVGAPIDTLWLNAVVESVEVRTCDNETHVLLVLRVKLQWLRGPLWSGPEKCSARRDRVLWKVVQELLDGIVVLLLELHAGPDNAVLEGEWLFGDQVVAD